MQKGMNLIMATKSRLGKGLGALFPSLPGEPQHQEHAASAAAAKEVKASKTDEHVESERVRYRTGIGERRAGDEACCFT